MAMDGTALVSAPPVPVSEMRIQTLFISFIQMAILKEERSSDAPSCSAQLFDYL